MTRAIATLAVAGTVLGMLVSTVQAQERDEVLHSVSEGDTDLPNDNSTPGRVAVGGSATGDIGIPKDQDRFAVDLEAGRTYRFDLTGRPGGGGTLRDTYFRAIYNSEGRYQSGSYNDDFDGGRDSRVTFIPTQSGTYYARVSGDRNETGTYTLSVTDVTPEQGAGPPAKPRGMSATASHGQVVLTWADPGDDSITGYVILRRVRVNDTGGDFGVLVADTGTAALTYTDNTVAASLTYTYRIKAINAHGVSERSRWFHVDIPAAPVPAQPTGLSATASHDAITLTWDDPDDDSITGYVILRRNRDTDEEGHFDELVADTGSAATTYTDDTVAADTRYTYRIKAINAYGVSERSRWLHIATPAAPEPEEEPAADPDAKPTGILSAAGHDTVLLSWTDPQDDSITGYRILRADVVDGVRGEFAVLSEDTGSAAASYTDDAVEPETSYVYRVLAINPGGVSEPSRDVEVSTPAAPEATFVEADDPADPDGEDDPVGAPGGGTRQLSSICDRTAQVRDAIMAAIVGVSDCAEVTTTQLASVTGTFNLEDDNIQSLQSGDFSGLTALDKLWLNDNDLTSLPAGVFSDLDALKSLDLHDNDLTSLRADVFSGLTELTYLSLSGNALSTLPDADVFSDLTELTYLNLSRNTLSALPAGVFSGLTELTFLSLSRNTLSALRADVFSDLTALESLYLYDNALTSLPDGVFSGLTALKLLWLYDNDLESLRADVFSDLTALEKLRLNNALNNALTSLPAGVFSGLTALEELWLHDNALTSLPADVFSDLEALELLRLYDNALTSLPAGVFSGLTALEELLLRNNALTSLPAGVFSGLTKLKTLWLHDNALTSLPAGVFSGLTKLKNLLLRDNALTSLPAGVFSGLEELGLLDLHNNNLTSLPDGVFSGLEELLLLDLRHNPDTDDLLPLSVTLEHVGPNQVLAKVLAGAPLTVDIPVTIAGGERMFTVEAGKVEGTVVTVTGISTEPVTGEISTQPSLDGPLGDHDHRGYIFVVVDVVDLPANTTTTSMVEVGGDGARSTIYKPIFVERTGGNDVDGYEFDTDWFAVELKKGRTYRIDMKGAIPTNDLTLRLPQINAIYDADGESLVNTRSRDESISHHLFRVTFHAHAGGTYYIAASGESFEWGYYELTVKKIKSSSKPAVADGPPGLAPNAPNPFNGNTVIPYRLDADGPVRLEIYNLLGQRIRTLVDEAQTAGVYRVHWDARDAAGRSVATGIYFTRLHYPGGVHTRRMLYLE